MLAYIVRRILLMIPTLFGIMVINFVIIQVAPGGPVEQIISELRGTAVDPTARFSGTGGDIQGSQQQQSQQTGSTNSRYRGAQGLDPEIIADIEKQFGFDKPLHVRFFNMLRDYVVFDFGESLFSGRPVVDIVISKMPVSISLGLWTTLIMYLISIPLGIAKATRDGSRFDTWTSAVIVALSAIPDFLFAILLIILFAGGSYFQWFPLRGLVSDDWRQMGILELIGDYFWHMTLPLLALVIGSFAGLTMLTKNSFLDQIHNQYVVTARSKGLTEHRVLYGHVFRNAMLIVIAGFPGAFVGIFFAGTLLIENIFSLDGLGLLSWESVIKRDYPIMFGTMYFYTLLGLLMRLIGDLSYTIVDPRIDFERRAI
jgi:microcin C transport system permease protein